MILPFGKVTVVVTGRISPAIFNKNYINTVTVNKHLVQQYAVPSSTNEIHIHICVNAHKHKWESHDYTQINK